MRKILSNINMPELPTIDIADMEYLDHIWINSKIYIDRIYLGQNGIIVVLPLPRTRAEKFEITKKEIMESLKLYQHIYFVYANEDNAIYVSGQDDQQVIEDVDEFVTALALATSKERLSPDQIIVDDVLDFIPDETTEDVTVIDIKTIERLAEQLVPLENNERPDDNIVIDEYGNKYIKKDSTYKLNVGITSIDTGLLNKEVLYPIADIEPMIMTYLAALGGCFGLHKFKTGNKMAGLMYLLTCGFGGFLAAIDTLLITFGGYYFDHIIFTPNGTKDRWGIDNCDKKDTRLYIDKGNPKIGIPLAIIALVIGMVLVRAIYLPAYKTVVSIITQMAVNLYQN